MIFKFKLQYIFFIDLFDGGKFNIQIINFKLIVYNYAKFPRMLILLVEIKEIKPSEESDQAVAMNDHASDTNSMFSKSILRLQHPAAGGRDTCFDYR